MKKQIQKYIKKISFNSRCILILHWYYDLDFSAISEILGMNIYAVRFLHNFHIKRIKLLRKVKA